MKLHVLIAFAAAASAAVSAQVPNPDVARAAAAQVDQAMQAARTGKESMDRTAPLLTVEPHADPADEAAWRKKKEEAAKKALEASEPN